MKQICKKQTKYQKRQASLGNLGEKSEEVANPKQKKLPAEPTGSLEEGQRLIPLTQGKFAIVDAADYEWLSKFKWFAYCTHRATFYAGRGVRMGKRTKMRPMHRDILNLNDPKIYADHKNGNGLDNRRCNLRPATNQQNQMGKKRRMIGTKSKYRGVGRAGWVATICHKNKRKHIGVFETEIEAAKAWDKRAIELGFFPEALNFPPKQ